MIVCHEPGHPVDGPLFTICTSVDPGVRSVTSTTKTDSYLGFSRVVLDQRHWCLPHSLTGTPGPTVSLTSSI